MRKTVLNFIMICLFLLMIQTSVNADLNDLTPIYSVDGITLNEFLSDADVNKLKQEAGKKSFFEVKNNNAIRVIEGLSEQADDFIFLNVKGGTIMGNEDFVELINSKEGITNILHEKYPEVIPADVFLIETNSADIYSQEFPHTICVVDTCSNIYFITLFYFGYIHTDIDEMVLNAENCVYDFDDYSGKYGIKAAKLIIDSKIISNNIKMQNEEIHMPIRILLEQLGSKVEWSQEDESVVFRIADQVYKFYFGGSRLCRLEKGNYKVIDQWWGHNSDIIDDRVVINGNIVEGLLKLYGKNLRIDFSNRILEILNK